MNVQCNSRVIYLTSNKCTWWICVGNGNTKLFSWVSCTSLLSEWLISRFCLQLSRAHFIDVISLSGMFHSTLERFTIWRNDKNDSKGFARHYGCLWHCGGAVEGPQSARPARHHCKTGNLRSQLCCKLSAYESFTTWNMSSFICYRKIAA